MPLWSSNSANSSAKPQYLNTADKSNTSGVTNAVEANTGYAAGIGHSGWILQKVGTGQVSYTQVTSGGTGYANTDTFAITANVASNNGSGATGTIGTNGNGVITSATMTAFGTGYDHNPVLTITTAGGSGATLTPVLGGRAGRVEHETIVALSSMT